MKSTSHARIRANRENAKKSTGPRTPAGKAVSRRNAIKHGLTARLLLTFDSEGTHNALLTDLYHRFQPAGTAEELALQRMAFGMVRLDSVVAMEYGVTEQASRDAFRPRAAHHPTREHGPDWIFYGDFFMTDCDNKRPYFQMLLRYETALENQVMRSLRLFEALEKRRPAPDAPPPQPLELENPLPNLNEQPEKPENSEKPPAEPAPEPPKTSPESTICETDPTEVWQPYYKLALAQKTEEKSNKLGSEPDPKHGPEEKS